jgi:hypothetical protein
VHACATPSVPHRHLYARSPIACVICANMTGVPPIGIQAFGSLHTPPSPPVSSEPRGSFVASFHFQHVFISFDFHLLDIFRFRLSCTIPFLHRRLLTSSSPDMRLKIYAPRCQYPRKEVSTSLFHAYIDIYDIHSYSICLFHHDLTHYLRFRMYSFNFSFVLLVTTFLRHVHEMSVLCSFFIQIRKQ